MQISTNAVLALSPTAGFGSCIINLELEIVFHPSHIFNATTIIASEQTTVCSSIGTVLLSLYGPLAAVNCYRTTTARKKPHLALLFNTLHQLVNPNHTNTNVRHDGGHILPSFYDPQSPVAIHAIRHAVVARPLSYSRPMRNVIFRPTNRRMVQCATASSRDRIRPKRRQ